MRIIFATGNAGKMREIREIMADMDMAFVRQIIGVQGAQQGGFSAAGMAMQHHAFAVADL